MSSQDEMVIRVLVAAGALVAVPLGLRLLDGSLVRRRWALGLEASAVAFAGAMVVGTGPAAVVLAAPLAAGAVVVAILELRLLATAATLDRLATALAACWLAGATVDACFALTEAGAPFTPGHLRWPTPAHFFFAGFGLTTLALATHRTRRRPTSFAALLTVLVGMPLLAVEIAAFPTLQWTGALLMSAAAVLVALQQLLAARASRRPVRSLLTVSSFSLATAMVFAVAYGLATRFDLPSPSLRVMVRTHGILNSVGFVIVGLVAWRIHQTEESDANSHDALSVARA